MMGKTVFKVGDIVKFKNEFEPEEAYYTEQKDYVPGMGYEFNKPYKIIKIDSGFIYLGYGTIGHFADRFELYEEELELPEQTKSNSYCNCGGPWVLNHACNKSFKVCKSCGKEVL